MSRLCSRSLTRGLMTGAFVLSHGAAALADARFHSKNIGAFGTHDRMQANAMNDFGEVVGYGQVCHDQTGYRPFRWNYDEGITELFPSNALGFGVGARHINNAGMIAGYFYETDAPSPCSNAPIPTIPFGVRERSVVWNRDGLGVEQQLPGVGDSLGIPHIQSSISDINDFGDIVGVSIDGFDQFSAQWRGFLYSANNFTLTNLESAGGPGVTIRNAVGINNAGEIVAQANVAGEDRLVFMDAQGGAQLIPRLTDGTEGDEKPVAVALREDGTVLAWFELWVTVDSGIGFDTHVEYGGIFTWHPDTGMTDLRPTLPMGRKVVPAAFNERGEIVALDSTPSNSPNPEDWLPIAYHFDGQSWRRLDDLATVIYPDGGDEFFNETFWAPRAINESGQVLINVSFDGEQILFPSFASFVLTPYPEQTGDVNRDGIVNGLDIAPFVSVLMGDATSLFEEAAADTNQDNRSNVDDIPSMVAALLNG